MKFMVWIGLCLALFVHPLAAQWDQTSYDRSKGEQEQILERQKWFVERGGFEKVKNPGELRKKAVEQARTMKEVEESTRAATMVWEEAGPSPMTMFSWVMGNVAGRVNALAMDPNNLDTMYLGAAAGGVWKTTNGGGAWTPIFDDVGTLAIGSIVLDPQNANHIWVGTGEYWVSCYSYQGLGLFKSEDGGSTWSSKNGSGSNTLDLSFVNAVRVHPTNSQLVMAGGHGYCLSDGTKNQGGLFRTTDGGANWTKMLNGAVQDIINHPSQPNTFFAAIGRDAESENGIWKSTDSGANWTRLTSGLPSGTSVQRMRIAQAPSDANTLYVLANEGNTRLYRSTNGGSSWSLRNTNACEGQCSYNLCLAVHPTNPNTLLVGSIRHARSTNGGSSLSYLTNGWGSSQTVHQDTHVLAYHPTNGNVFWVGTDGGLWRTDNNSSSYNNLNSNLNITQLYDIAVNPNDPFTIFGGSQDNSSERTTGNTVWDVTVVSGDGFMNLVDPLNTNRVFQTSYAYASGGGELPRIYRSNSGGAPGTLGQMSNSGISPGPFDWVVPLAVADNGSTAYIFCGSNRPYRAVTSGNSWTSMANNGQTGTAEISVLAPMFSGGNLTLYVGNEDGEIYRTDNGMAGSPSWSNVTGNYPGDEVTDIAVDSSNPLRVFITRGGFGASRLYSSTSGGTTWNAIGAGLPDAPANSVAIDPKDNTHIFVATDVGIFESTDSGLNFVSMMNGMPLGMVSMDLEVTENPHTLTVGTYGRGAWQMTLSDGGGTGGNWVEIANDDFESGWGSYTDGGNDCRRSANDSAFAHQGTYCVRIRDNSGTASSIFSTNSFDLSGYTEFRINFWYRPESMENNEDFFVEYYNGSAWQILASYASGSDFSNGSFYNPEIIINSSSYNFPTNAQIRIRCDASGNGDRIYLDEIVISGR